jgi:hypothetical protein
LPKFLRPAKNRETEDEISRQGMMPDGRVECICDEKSEKLCPPQGRIAPTGYRREKSTNRALKIHLAGHLLDCGREGLK